MRKILQAKQLAKALGNFPLFKAFHSASAAKNLSVSYR